MTDNTIQADQCEKVYMTTTTQLKNMNISSDHPAYQYALAREANDLALKNANSNKLRMKRIFNSLLGYTFEFRMLAPSNIYKVRKAFNKINAPHDFDQLQPIFSKLNEDQADLKLRAATPANYSVSDPSVLNTILLENLHLTNYSLLTLWYDNSHLFYKMNGRPRHEQFLKLRDGPLASLAMMLLTTQFVTNEIEFQAFGLGNLEALGKELLARLPQGEQTASLVTQLTSTMETVTKGANLSYRFALIMGLGYTSSRFIESKSITDGLILASLTAYIVINHGKDFIEWVSEYGSKFSNFFEQCLQKAISVFDKTSSSVSRKGRDKLSQTFNQRFGNVQYQSQAEASEWVNMAAEALSVITTITVGTRVPPSALSNVLRMSETLPKFFTKIVQLLSDISDKLLKTKFGALLSLNTQGNPLLIDYDSKVTTLLRDRADGKLEMTTTNLNIITAAVDEGEALYRQTPNGKDFESIKRLLYMRLGELRKLEKEFRLFNIKQSGFRTETVGVLFKGGPGVMKSTIMEHAVSAAHSISLSKDEYEDCKQNPHLYVYNRQHETGHWDGYTPKVNVITIDDLGQAKDVAGNSDNEYMNVIRIINSFQMDLHMAELTKKGVVKMSAKFLIASTNHMRFKAESLTNSFALNRRFPLQYYVVPKDEFCLNPSDVPYDRKIDFTKIQRNKMGQPNILPEHFDFIPSDPKSGDVLKPSKPISFSDVVAQMNDEHSKRKAWKSQHEINFYDTMDTYRHTYHPEDYEVPVEYEDEDTYTSDITMENIEPQSAFIKSIFNSNPLESRFHERYEDPITVPVLSNHDFPEFMINDTITHYLKHNHPDDQDKLRLNFEEAWEVFINNQSCYECLGADNFLINTPWKSLCVMPLKWAHFCLAIKHPEFYYNVIDSAYTALDSFNEYFTCYQDICVPFYLPPREISLKQQISEEFNKIRKRSLRRISPILEYLSSIKYQILALATFIAGSTFLWKLYGPQAEIVNDDLDQEMDIPSPPDRVTPEMDYTFTRATKKNKMSSLAKARAKHSASFQNADAQGSDIMKSITARNVFTAHASINGRRIFLGSVIGLRTDYILAPTHYISALDNLLSESNEESIALTITNGDIHIGQIDWKDLLENANDEYLQDADTTLIKMDTIPVRDIVNQFLTDNSIANLPRVFHTSMQFPKTPHADAKIIINSQTFRQTVPMDDIHVTKAIQYVANTTKGDCGVPIFYRETKGGNQRIMGFHFAGSANSKSDNAFATLISQEELLKSIAIFEVLPTEDISELDIENQGGPLFIRDRFKVLGRSKYKHNPYGSNDLIPSALSNAILLQKPTYFPAMMHPRNGIDPLEKAISKFCITGVTVDKSNLDSAADNYLAFLTSSLIECPKRLLTIEEAIWGSQELNIESIKSQSSPGYPIKWTNSKLKQGLFGLDVPRDKSNPYYKYIEGEVTQLINDLINGKRRLWVFTDNIKSELRPKQKVLDGATRGFSGCPLIYFIVFRIYYGGFMGWIRTLSDRQESGMSITMNERSREWTILVKRLSKFSIKENFEVGSGDYKGFDGSEMPIVHNKINSMIKSILGDDLTPERSRIMDILFLEVTHSRHIINDTVYEWHGSLPSGHPLTIIINCMYNHLAFRYCWNLVPECRKRDFNTHVVLEVTGDDNIYTVHNDYKNLFNELTIPILMKKFGLTMTLDTKGGAEKPWRTLSEVSYLKRGFRKSHFHVGYAAPLDFESMSNTIMWTRKQLSTSISIERVENYVQELAQYPPEFFEQKRNDLIRSIREYAPELNSADIRQSQWQMFASLYTDIPEM